MKALSDNTYAVISTADIDNVRFDQLLDTSVDTLRCNNDNTKCIVKWIGNVPSSIAAIDYEGPYTHQEIKQVLRTASWIQIEE